MKKTPPDENLIRRTMQRALRLARRGEGWTSPNPMVGAVLIKNGRVIGEGWHHAAGRPHAEVEAINDCRRHGHDPRGAAMVVTLEPCCHFGRTPPCTEAIAAAGIREVYVAHQDVNPLVCGNGVACLLDDRIKVEVGIMAREAMILNEVFTKWSQTGEPFVVLKAASTLDGKIATASGDSQWVSGAQSLRFAHQLRHRYDAIMVGVGTVLADDPQLTCRLPGRQKFKHPLRIIVDSQLRTPLEAKVVSGGLPGRTILAVTDRAKRSKIKKMEQLGVEVLVLPADRQGWVDLPALTKTLGKRDITSLLVEGGGTVLAACLAAGVGDKLSLVMAPKIVGGARAISSFQGELAATMDQARRLHDMSVRRLGKDFLFEGYFQPRCLPD